VQNINQSSDVPAQDPLEVICHLSAYSAVLTLVTVASPEQMAQVAKQVKAGYPGRSLMVHASSLGLGVSLLQKLMDYFQLVDPVSQSDQWEALRSAAQTHAEGTDPLLVLVERGDLMTLDLLMEAAELSQLAPHALSICILGMNGYDRGLTEDRCTVPLYRIDMPIAELPGVSANIAEPMASLDSVIVPTQADEAEKGASSLSVGSDQNAQRHSPSVRLLGLAGVREKLMALLDKTLVVGGLELPLLHAAAATVALLIVLILAIDGLSGDESQQSVALESVTLSVPERPAFSADSPLDRSHDRALPAETTAESRALLPKETVPAKTTGLSDEGNLSAGQQDMKVAKEPKSLNSAGSLAADVSEQVNSKVPENRSNPGVLAEDGFVVQLFGSWEKARADDFIHQWRANVPGDLQRVLTRRDGKAWYIVVMSKYSSRDEARAAIALLPTSLSRQSPWIREASSIK
jgi:hypothetical protein